MSLCDRCFAPGQCCKRMSLSTEHGALTNWVDEGALAQMERYGLPFVPVETYGPWVHEVEDEDLGRRYEEHRWACTKLLPDGRCGDYENRPALCREFEAGVSNRLCVHFMGAEGGDPTLSIDILI